MSHIPSELKYATSHEWVRVEANGEAVVGITEHAQDLLGTWCSSICRKWASR